MTRLSATVDMYRDGPMAVLVGYDCYGRVERRFWLTREELTRLVESTKTHPMPLFEHVAETQES